MHLELMKTLGGTQEKEKGERNGQLPFMAYLYKLPSNFFRSWVIFNSLVHASVMIYQL